MQEQPINPPRRQLSTTSSNVREALKLLRDTVIEDRKQIMLRIGLAVGILAFTFKDLKVPSQRPDLILIVLVGLGVACLMIGSVFYLNYYHKAIGLMGELSRCVAYADISHEDLGASERYWQSKRSVWYAGSTLFFLGAASY
jgi:hypothetical protein